MQDNRNLAHQAALNAIGQYENGLITASDLLQSLEREIDTAENFLDVYLDWRQALLRLQELTYYDFESGQPVLERFGIGLPGTPEALPVIGSD